MKRWAIRLGLVFCAFALTVPVAEIAFRLAGVHPPQGTEGVFEQFEHGYYRLAPSRTTLRPTYPKNFTIRTSSLGMRIHLDEKEWDPAEGPLDILMIGDSVMVGDRVDYGESFAGLFSEYAAATGLRTANMAVQAHSLHNQIEQLRWLRDKNSVRPRSVLIGVGPEAVAKCHQMFKPYVYNGGLWQSKPGKLALAKFWVARNSAIYMLLRNIKMRYFGAEASDRILNYYRRATLDDRAPHLTRVLGEFREILGADTSIVVAFLPDANYPYIADLARAAGEEKTASVDRMVGVVRDAAKSIDAKFLDLREPLERFRASGGQLGHANDPHFTAEANGIVARELWAGLDWHALARSPRD